MRQRKPAFGRQPSSTQKFKTKFHHANSKQEAIHTCGVLFSDGTLIEVIQDAATGRLCLLVSEGDDHKIAPEVKFRGRIYRPANINRSIFCATRFPLKREGFGSTAELFTEVRNTFMSRGFAEEVALPATYFNFAAWFPDCLPAAPCLSISGPEAEARLLLELLGCMVRHPLPLAEITRSGFCSLPMILQPTLLIQTRASRSAWELLTASNNRKAYIVWRGSLLGMSCAKAVYAGEAAEGADLGDSVLKINLTPSRGRLPVLDGRDQQKISERFQAKFLDYRCRNVMKVRESRCDFPELDSSIRILGRILGAPIADAPELQADLAPLLREYQEGIRASKWLDLRCVTLEAILHHCHEEPGRRVRVGRLADTVNLILKGRGETTEFEPEVIGGILRRQLGFSPKRDSPGFFILLDNRVRRYAHLLAHSYDVAAVQECIAKCSHCSAILATEEIGNQDDSASEGEES